MNPFRPTAAKEFSEDDLLAFHLHELSPSRERALRLAIETDAALAAESEAVAASLDALKDVPMHVDDTMLERNWKALRPALLPHARPLVRARRWRLPVFTGAAMAIAATAVFFVTAHRPAAGTKRAGAHARPATPDPLPALEQKQATEGGQPNGGGEPLFKGNLHTGLFHPRAGQLGPPIHPLTLAQVPPALPLAPPVTSEADTPAHEPVAPTVASSSMGQPVQPIGEGQAQPSGVGQEQAHGLKKVKPGGTVKAKREHTLDVMLAIGGNFVAPHTSVIAVTQRSTMTVTHAIAALGAIHQQFRPALGYRITASYSRPDFNYSYGGTGEINSRIYEVAGTYVVQGPHHGRLGTSGDVGAGLLTFLPTVSSSNTSYVYRGAGVLGVNVDYALTRHWGARLAYRAQVFKSPDFRYNGGTIPVSSGVTVSSEPSLGVTYNFGKD